MKAFRVVSSLLVLLMLSVTPAPGQGSFDLEAYRQFLANHQNMTSEELQAMYPAGIFAEEAQARLFSARYFDSIDVRYHLTSYERSLLAGHSFMATERLQYGSFGQAFDEIYHRDLPVFVSTDAILHSLHMSYDAILMRVEELTLLNRLGTLLAALHAQVPSLAERYDTIPGMQASLSDVDLYLTVARKLFGATVSPVFPQNTAPVNQLLAFVQTYQPQQVSLFSDSTMRVIDFSQFRVRGHYTQGPALGRYFQAMMWLGRTEIWLDAPQGVSFPAPRESDIQRQTVDAVLISEATHLADAGGQLQEFDDILRFFVGDCDNVTLANIDTLTSEAQIVRASQLLDLQRFRDFRQLLLEHPFAFQRINSQLLWSSPTEADSARPPSSFLLLGQRFVVDSYTMGNVVYDKIVYNGFRVTRMLPASLDVLFSLGNDAALQLLDPQLEVYHYALNLAAVRYLIDAYEPQWWQSSLYNAWLNCLRQVNPPQQRATLPPFMKTAAWWQEKMNTQMASWAQLRHDNLLYAKQSYSGIPICSFPESYVEPFPEFYDAVGALATRAATAFRNPPLSEPWVAPYFDAMKGTSDTLAAIARKELLRTPITQEERRFLREMLHRGPVGCDTSYVGWYAQLFYTHVNGLMDSDMVVADVHTAPADSLGNPVGWVLHGGTGPVNLAVVLAPTATPGDTVAYIGPVLSYYEHVSVNFTRLTDEEWRALYAIPPSFRPSLVNLYLADSAGNSRGPGPSLITGSGETPPPPTIPATAVLAQNFPNPFNGSTIIGFSIPGRNSAVELSIFDIQGQRVRTLLRQNMPGGNFLVRWDGLNDAGVPVASGAYFYRLKAGDVATSKRMTVLK